MEISLCMIVKNEEDVIQKCIMSSIDLVDEIIILDTGSTDSTLQKIEELNLSNIRVEKFEWVNDFSKARNKSLEFATKDWVLILDADEVLKYKSKKDIEEFIINDGSDVYSIGIYNHVGKSNMIYSNVMFRLFKRSGVFFEGSIHEKITINGEPKILNYATLPDDICCIEHFGYSAEIVKKKNKAKRNIEISLKELQKDTKDDLKWYNCATAYLMDKNYEEAIKYFQEVESISGGITKSYHIDAVFKKTDCLIKLERPKEALEFISRYSGNEYLTLYPDFYYFMGKANENLERYSDALESFNKALTMNNTNMSFSVKGTNSYITLIEIGRVYMSIGQTQVGIEYILKGIFNEENTFLQGIDDIKDFLSKKGAVETLEKLESLEIKHKLLMANDNRDKEFIKKIATKYTEEGKIKESKKILMDYDPNFDDIELNNILSVALMLEGDYDTAELVLKKNLSIDSNDFNTKFNMGYISIYKGATENAIQIFNSLLSDADDSVKKEIQEILSNLII